MNVRRGILRLALVLSILVAIILPFFLLEKHPWVTCRVARYEYEKEEIDKAEIEIENQYAQTRKRSEKSELDRWMQSQIANRKKYELLKDKGQWYVYEFKWNGETSYQHGKVGIAASAKELVEICDEIDEQISSKTKVEGLPEGFRAGQIITDFKPEVWQGFPLKKGEGFYPSKRVKLRVDRLNEIPKREFFDDPDWQEHLRLVDITTHINWNRFFLVMVISFTSVWFLYAFVRLVIIRFIAEGFKNKSSKGGELG